MFARLLLKSCKPAIYIYIYRRKQRPAKAGSIWKPLRLFHLGLKEIFLSSRKDAIGALSYCTCQLQHFGTTWSHGWAGMLNHDHVKRHTRKAGCIGKAVTGRGCEELRAKVQIRCLQAQGRKLKPTHKGAQQRGKSAGPVPPGSASPRGAPGRHSRRSCRSCCWSSWSSSSSWSSWSS